ncbi:MAG: hypothetical protein OEZ65_06400 [Gemmatimonadota bacterium]|nr:hypothetical protein [Gemmatimonadota bacterium]
MSKKSNLKVRLLFADGGAFHHEDVEIPSASMKGYDRIIDCVREDEAVLKRIYVDVDRLCAAYLIDE